MDTYHRGKKEIDRYKWKQLSLAAGMYYNDDMTQSEIAERLYISRSKVSRMLQEAKELGIVHIKVDYPWMHNTSMELAIKRKLGLDTAIVIHNQSNGGKEDFRSLIDASAQHLESVIGRDTTVGVSWGSTLYSIVKIICSENRKNMPIRVVPIMGGSNTDAEGRDALDLARQLADAYGGTYYHMHAPLYSKNRAEREAILKNEQIRQALEIARKSDVILTSVGSVFTESWKDYLSGHMLDRLKEKGVVGHMAGHFFDIHGRLLSSSLQDRMTGLSPEELRQCPNTICVAFGEGKAEAALGAVRAGLVNTLIVDDYCAGKILMVMENGKYIQNFE